MNTLHSLKVVFVLIGMTFAISSSSFGMMAMSWPVSIDEVISALEGLKSSGKIASEQMTVLTLAKISKDVVGVKKIYVFKDPTDQSTLNYLDAERIQTSILNEIHSDRNWSRTPDSESVAKILESRPLLEKVFGSKSFCWAWFLKQMGEKENAKRILSGLYADEYEKVMKLQTAVYGPGQTPIGEAEYLIDALKPMSTDKELKILKTEMQKMSIHVSRLPQADIST